MKYLLPLVVLFFTFVNTSTARAPYDFDGDGKTDFSIYRPNTGEWWYKNSSNSQWASFRFGTSIDKIVPADYTGDGKDDFAFFRPSTGEWFIARSEDFSYYSVQFGIGRNTPAIPFELNNDIPVPADYDGDKKADIAVWRRSSATWYILSSMGGVTIQQFGVPDADIPIPADYDGDGKSDIAVKRSNGEWWIQRSSLGVIRVEFGGGHTDLVVGDWTGDGKADLAYYWDFDRAWIIRRSEDGISYPIFTESGAEKRPSPGDYDGDGKFDPAFFIAAGPMNNWYVMKSSSTEVFRETFGLNGDRSVPNAFFRNY